MEIIPVIDLKSGQVVHARQGDRAQYRPIVTPLASSSAPDAVLAGLLRLHPFRTIYIADLDAIGGSGDHAELVRRLASAHPRLDFWVDNGLAAPAAMREWLARVPGRLVLGSESQSDDAALRALGGDPRIVLSLDFRGETFQGPEALLHEHALWPERVIAMTLARVGAGSGPDMERIAAIGRHARAVYAAGGVRDRGDLGALAKIGAAGALVATALHSGALAREDLNEIARR